MYLTVTVARFLGLISLLVVWTAIDTAQARQPDVTQDANATQPTNYSPVAHVHIDPTGPVPPLAHPAAGGPPSNVSYQGGPVQQALTTYTIFWDPGGTISSSYRNLIKRYFQDIGGSSFYNIVSQYYQLPGPTFVQNVSALGGTWIDISPYPHGKGTVSNPLSDLDIEDEVTRALAMNPGWNPTGLGKTYFVYTEPGVESCIDPTPGSQVSACTYGVAAAQHYCGYHAYFGTSDNPVIYASMPYAQTWNFDCQYTLNESPNGDIAADKEISTSSHEQFEAVTDPLLNAWFDSSQGQDQGQEIGDKCNLVYGSISPDGHNLVLNGHSYIAQLEWSNASSDGVTPLSGCVKAYGADVTTPTPSPTPTQSVKGDINCDGFTNGDDLLALLDYAAGANRLAHSQDTSCPPLGSNAGNGHIAGDLNCDGLVNANDALVDLLIVANLPVSGLSACST